MEDINQVDFQADSEDVTLLLMLIIAVTQPSASECKASA